MKILLIVGLIQFWPLCLVYIALVLVIIDVLACALSDSF